MKKQTKTAGREPECWVLSFIIRSLIFGYRHSLSYFLGSRCRFFPTCSVYADEAIKIHGPWKGLIMTFRRLGRCHPWGGCGYDPVPGKEKAGIDSGGSFS